MLCRRRNDIRCSPHHQ